MDLIWVNFAEMKLLIKTFAGLEEVLAQEIQELGGTSVILKKRGVSCEGNIAFLYKANLCLHTALRVLVPVYEFKAKNEKELYNQIKNFDWSRFLGLNQTFAIDNTIFSTYFPHAKFAALKMKDAIADQYREKHDQRPSVDTENPDVLFNLHGYNENFTVSLDSSGQPLNQRGYRGNGHAAPLNEVLAAGLIRLSGWNASQPLVDPFCGTGTILIEAAMIATKTPPQLLRESFGFKTWNSFEPIIWNRVKAEVRSGIRKTPLYIYGSDIDPKAIDMAKQSLKKLALRADIRLSVGSFDSHLPKHREGMIITNPPYGERIGTNVEELYNQFGHTLKHTYSGYDAWIISSSKAALKQLRLKPQERILMYNGKLDCEFCHYPLYQGSLEMEENSDATESDAGEGH